MNVTGAIAGSVGTTPGQIIIRGALAIILSGAELLAAVALVRVMLAQNAWRKVAGAVIFIGLAWACIQNGKRAVHLVYPEFAESATLLTAKAEIAKKDADDFEAARTAAVSATPAELAQVRTEIAALKAEQTLMASQSPENIKKAQALLIAQGKYYGEVDGLRERLTEAAMRSRGEELSNELGLLKIREDGLINGVVAAPVADDGPEIVPASVLQADLEDRARKSAAATIWLEVMLWVFEGARSFGLWALVATITAPKNRRKDDAPEAPEEVEEDEAPELTPRELALKKAQDAAATENKRGKIPISDHSVFDTDEGEADE
jgi:hypothetical protein